MQSGLELHWLASGQTHDAGLIPVSVPFVLQLVACVLSYLARDGAAGAAAGVLSVIWLSQGMVHLGSAAGSRAARWG